MTGDELRERLADAERRPAWLAEKLGVSGTQVSRWLGGDKISDRRAREIDALLVPAPTLPDAA